MTPTPRLLHEPLTASARSVPDKTAIIAEGISHSYHDVLDRARRLASALVSRGLSRGGRVGIFMDNTFDAAVAIYGTLMAGGVFVMINPQTKSDKLGFILDNSDAGILLTDEHLSGTYLSAPMNRAKLSAILVAGASAVGAPRGDCPRIESYDAAIGDATPIDTPVFTIPLDLAALVYTSGSTGNPKGVMMTHQAMLFAAQSIAEYLRLDSSQVILNVLPLAFDYGLYQLLMTVLLGATLVLEASFTYPAQTLKRMTDHRVTVFPGVPTIYSTLISMHRRKPLHFPLIQGITNTAAALPADYTAELHQIFPNALIYRMYGLTECKRVCYLEPELADVKPDSVGRAIPGTETFLLSLEGQPVQPGQPGILHVRGPHVMLGYWKDPELSRTMLKEGSLPGERVLCTHDWFTMDSDGDLYFKGRSDDIIKSRGEKISPIEVENVLLGIKGVREAAVIGVPDELLGQAVKAFVALDDQAIAVRDILKHCAAKLENFMVPKIVAIVAALPRTDSGKISKKGLV